MSSVLIRHLWWLMTSFICMQALRWLFFFFQIEIEECGKLPQSLSFSGIKIVQKRIYWPFKLMNVMSSQWFNKWSLALTRSEWTAEDLFGIVYLMLKFQCLLTLYILLEFDRRKRFHPASTATGWNAGENVSILLAWCHPPVSGETPLSDVSMLTLHFYPHCSHV